MLVDVCRDHRADRDDAQACITSGLQRLTDENRCQTTSFECVIHLGVGEDALAVAIAELGQPDRLPVDGDGEAVGIGGDLRRCAGLVGGDVDSYTRGFGRGRRVALGRGGAGRRDPW
jgi:hypothetical protein